MTGESLATAPEKRRPGAGAAEATVRPVGREAELVVHAAAQRGERLREAPALRERERQRQVENRPRRRERELHRGVVDPERARLERALQPDATVLLDPAVRARQRKRR